MRSNMYSKILQLPIGYFTEQRKWRYHESPQTTWVMENSTISVLESLFREPITILLFFTYMIILSPQLTLFLLIFLPVAGLILGRIGRSLKRKIKWCCSNSGKCFRRSRKRWAVYAYRHSMRSKKNTAQVRRGEYGHVPPEEQSQPAARPGFARFRGAGRDIRCFASSGMAGRLVLSGDATFTLNAGDFLAYIAIFTQLIQPLKGLSSASYNIQKGAASIERDRSADTRTGGYQGKPDAIALSSFTRSIELKNVSFCIPG